MNWFPVGKNGANKVYTSQSECESAEGQSCFDITGKDLRYHEVVDGDLVENSDTKAAVLAADAAKAAYEAALNVRLGRQQKAMRVIALIGHLNEQKSLTQEQVVSFVQTYSSIQLMLLGLSIPTARAMIAAVTPDGVIVTQADKDALLAEIDS